jgi:hypothetical protein
MAFVQLADTLEYVHADWAAANAVQKGGFYYATDPGRSGCGARTESSAMPGSDFDRGKAVAKASSEQTPANPTLDFAKGQEIARALRQPTKSKGTSK